MNCPASIRAQKGLPDTDSEFAIEGTSAHTLSEWARNEDKPTSKWIDTKVPVKLVTGKIREVLVTKAMANHVQEFVDYCNALGGTHLVETRVRFEQFVPGGYGTKDHGSLHPGWAAIVDLKYGMGIKKFAKWNSQLMLYALGVWLDWDWLYGFSEFQLTIHQPRLDHVDSWTISVADLLKWAREELVPAYKRTLDPKAPFKPGSWCKFCRIDGNCKAQVTAKFEAAQGEFTNLNELTPTPVDTLTLDEMAALKLDHFPGIKAWMAAVEKKLYAALLTGKKAGDLKLVEGKSDRALVEGAAEQLEAEIPEGESIYEAPKLKSVAQLEELIPNGKKRFKGPQKTKEAGDLFHLVRRPKGRPTIAAGDDPKPAINFDASEEFSNLNEGDDENE